MKHEIIATPQCLCCKHFRFGSPERVSRCAAYPDGIPDAIFFDRVTHTKPYAGDHGIRYEKADITLVTA